MSRREPPHKHAITLFTQFQDLSSAVYYPSEARAFQSFRLKPPSSPPFLSPLKCIRHYYLKVSRCLAHPSAGKRYSAPLESPCSYVGLLVVSGVPFPALLMAGILSNRDIVGWYRVVVLRSSSHLAQLLGGLEFSRILHFYARKII